MPSSTSAPHSIPSVAGKQGLLFLVLCLRNKTCDIIFLGLRDTVVGVYKTSALADCRVWMGNPGAIGVKNIEIIMLRSNSGIERHTNSTDSSRPFPRNAAALPKCIPIASSSISSIPIRRVAGSRSVYTAHEDSTTGTVNGH